MASKRSLYRPAPQENVGQKRNRKPLVQGRLVSGDTGPKKSHSTLASGVEEPVTGNRAVKSPYRSFVKETSRSNVQMDSFQSVTDQESFTLTPRRKAPVLSEHRSPTMKSPATTLDLSDSDIEVQSKSPLTRIHKQRPQEVLLIDASRQTKDPNESEVDIRIGFEKSPVRIVCHSADPDKNNLRGTTTASSNKNTNNASRPVQILRENSHSKESPPPARLIIDSGCHEDSPKNLADGMERILTQIERDAKKGQLKFHQPNFDDSDDDRPTRERREPIRDRLENIDPELSDFSDVCSLNEYVTSAKKKSNTTKNAPEKAPAKAPYSGKKKNSRVIPSRYKQSAESKAKTSLSVLMDKNVSKNNKSKTSRSTVVPNKSRQKAVRKTAPPKSECHTPDDSRITSGGKTSTPTLDGSFFPTEIDASAIHADISVSSNAGDNKGNVGTRNQSAISKSKVHDPFSYSILSNASADITHHSSVKRSEPSKVTQHHIDLLYARYLTWLHMYSSAKKNRNEQEKQAMAQLHGLHKEVEKLRTKKHDLDVELTHLQRINMLDEQVELQRQSLGPVTAHLDKLSKEYENLAHALDTTRHQIPTKGVYLPDDEDQFQRKLEQELMASEQLLGELSVMIRQPVTTVTSMSKALQAMEKAVEAESHEIERCTEMLAASKSLAIQETSLQIQSMQAVET